MITQRNLSLPLTMKCYFFSQKFCQFSLLTALSLVINSSAQAATLTLNGSESVISSAQICPPWSSIENCIDATKIANSDAHFSGDQEHYSGFQYGYYSDDQFYPFTSENWMDDSWSNDIGGFKGSEGWVMPESQSGDRQLTRRWVSNINGGVKFSNDLELVTSPNSTTPPLPNSKVRVLVLVDGIAKDEFSASPNSSITYNFNVDVHKGSAVDFLIQTNDGSQINFDLNTDISIQPGISIRKNILETRSSGLPSVDCRTGECGIPVSLNSIEFDEEYKRSASRLGRPISSPQSFSTINGITGWNQIFTNGAIFQVGDSSRLFLVVGDIGSAYLYEYGAEMGLLGVPVSNVMTIENTLFQRFQGGILVTQSSGKTLMIPASFMSSREISFPGNFSTANEISLLNRKIIESSSYSQQNIMDDFIQRILEINELSKVQHQNTFGTFRKIKTAIPNINSFFSSYYYYDYYHYDEEIIPIKEEHIEFMSQKALNITGQAFLDTRSNAYSCAQQKGIFGSFSNAGLIEWLAEESENLNAREGFINNVIECYTPLASVYNYSGLATLSSQGNTSAGVMYYSQQSFNSLTNIPAFLSAEFLEYAIKKDLANYADDWLRILVEADELSLIDPQGRKLYYSHSEGLKNQIPDAFFHRQEILPSQSSAPPTGYPLPFPPANISSLGEDSPDNNSCESGGTSHPINSDLGKSRFQIFIPKRVEGKYTLEVAGQTFKPQVLAGDKEQTLVFTPKQSCTGDPPPSNNPPDRNIRDTVTPLPVDVVIKPPVTPPLAKTPEPSALLAILAMGGIGIVLRTTR